MERLTQITRKNRRTNSRREEMIDNRSLGKRQWRYKGSISNVNKWWGLKRWNDPDVGGEVFYRNVAIFFFFFLQNCIYLHFGRQRPSPTSTASSTVKLCMKYGNKAFRVPDVRIRGRMTGQLHEQAAEVAWYSFIHYDSYLEQVLVSL